MVREQTAPVQSETGVSNDGIGPGASSDAARCGDRVGIVGQMMCDAADALAEGVLLFDAEDVLVLCNAPARRLASDLSDLLRPGVAFHALMEAMATRCPACVPDGDPKAWLTRRLGGHEESTHEDSAGDTDGPVDLHVGSGEWRRIHVRALRGGGRLVTLVDITANKRADTTVANRERRLNNILDTVLDGIIVIDTKGVVQTFNLAAERLFGYRAEEAIGRPVSMLMPESDACHHQGYVDAYVQSGRARVMGQGREVRGRRKDGSTFPMELSLSEVREGGDHLFTGVVRDISARKQAEQALRDSEQRLALAMEGTSEAIVDWDPVTDRIVTGERLRAVMGVSPEGLRTLGDWMRVIHVEDRVDYAAALETALTDPEPHLQHEARLAVPAADGGARWVRHRAIAVRDPSGRTVRLVGSVGDITRSRRIAEGLRAARNAAELANRAKSEFLANMSHELRTPLNAIIGFSEMIAAETFGPLGSTQYREYLGDIRDSGQHLLRIIDDILDVSCIEAGTLTMDREPVAVHALMTSAAGLITHRAEAAGVALKLDVCPGARRITIPGDARRLKQVLLNLLSNAVKFTPRGGLVTLSCDCPASDMDCAHGLRIIVTDTGIGMDPAFIPKVLKPFHRLEGAMQRRYEGVGLGLPLSRAFVELHGGTLVLESAPGQGTRATVCLPLMAVRSDTPWRVETDAGLGSADCRCPGCDTHIAGARDDAGDPGAAADGQMPSLDRLPLEG